MGVLSCVPWHQANGEEAAGGHLRPCLPLGTSNPLLRGAVCTGVLGSDPGSPQSRGCLSSTCRPVLPLPQPFQQEPTFQPSAHQPAFLLSCSPLAPQPRRGDGLVTIRSPGAQLEFRVQPGRRFPAPPHSPLLSPLPPRGRGGCALACSESAPPSALGDLFHAQPLLFCEPLPSVEHAVLPSRPLRSPPQCLVTGSAVIPGGSHQSCAPEPNPVDTVSPSPPRTTHVPSPHRPPREALQARRRLHCWPHTHICLPQLAVPCWVLW